MNRLYLDKSNPAIWKSISAVSEQVARDAAAAGISKRCMELVNIRVSQINGCAYCLDLRTDRAEGWRNGPAPRRPARLAGDMPRRRAVRRRRPGSPRRR